MKLFQKSYLLIPLLTIAFGCQLTDEDYSGIIFTVHLEQKIIEAQGIHDAAVEGTAPTQFEPGSKQTLQGAITAAENVLSENRSQASIDGGFEVLEAVLNNFLLLKIPLDYEVTLINPSFEADGISTTIVEDFANITGWQSTPLRNDGNNGYEGWANASKISEVADATDGNYVASIASYGFGIFQTFEAALEGGATYNLTGDFKIAWSPADWQPVYYDTYVVTRFIVIDGDSPTYNWFGGFDNITVISENVTNLSNAETTDWESITHEFTLPAEDENVNRQFAVSIFIYEDGLDLNDAHNTNIWAESFVYIDNFSLTKSN